MKVKQNHAHVTTQIHRNQLFCGMYGLAAMLSIPRLIVSKNIDKIAAIIFYQ
jgi:hypothetical protein